MLGLQIQIRLAQVVLLLVGFVEKDFQVTDALLFALAIGSL